MNRVFTAAFIAAALLLLSHRPAHAMVEFCPAQLEYERVGKEPDKNGPSALYGLELTALGARTITSATIAFDTNNGWFTLTVPTLALAEKDHHYANSLSSFTRHDWVSPVLYARFPQEVQIARAWVYGASAQNDGPFGWQGLGPVSCPPPPDMSPEQQKRYRRPAVRRMRDKAYELENPDALNAAPAANSVVLAATASKPLESSDCPVPFQDAEVRSQAQPQFPNGMEGMLGDGMTSVEVALSPDGTLRDAWVWGPSGSDSYDLSAVRAARISRYSGARSYCMAVPSAYFFDVTFTPNAY